MEKLDLHAILRGLLPGALAPRLDRDLPAHLTLPAGRALIDYTEAPPLASAKAQAFYGMAATPRLAGGRVPLRLALLSPAGRPIAVTADLGRFLERRLGRCPARHAGALPEASLARRWRQSRAKLIRGFLLQP